MRNLIESDPTIPLADRMRAARMKYRACPGCGRLVEKGNPCLRCAEEKRETELLCRWDESLENGN